MITRTLRLAFFAALISTSWAADPTAKEVTKDVFDGKSIENFTSADGKAHGAGWVVEDGVIFRKSTSGDLYLPGEYGDFTFEFEWKISSGGNSGVKYKVQSFGKDWLGPEYQILDDEKHPDAKLGLNRQTAAFYDVKAPDTSKKKLNPVGEWNTSKIVVKGTKFEHWLNSQLVMEIDTTSDEFKKDLAASKFKSKAGFAQNAKGRIFLQDHGDKVWFRNLKLTTADSTPQPEKK